MLELLLSGSWQLSFFEEATRWGSVVDWFWSSSPCISGATLTLFSQVFLSQLLSCVLEFVSQDYRLCSQQDGHLEYTSQIWSHSHIHTLRTGLWKFVLDNYSLVCLQIWDSCSISNKWQRPEETRDIDSQQKCWFFSPWFSSISPISYEPECLAKVTSLLRSTLAHSPLLLSHPSFLVRSPDERWPKHTLQSLSSSCCFCKGCANWSWGLCIA